MRSYRRRWAALAALSSALLFLPATASTQQSRAEATTEYQLKAVFLYKFLYFVEWPKQSQQPAEDGAPRKVICVFGEDPFGQNLERVIEAHEDADTQVELLRSRTVKEADRCDLAFISRSLQHELPAILTELAALPLVSVSDIRGFAAKGGTIELLVEKKKIRFTINKAAADRHSITISSRLLRLATSVVSTEPPQ